MPNFVMRYMAKALYLIVILWVAFPNICVAQSDAKLDEEALYVREIFNEVLRNGKSYDWLYEMCTTIGPRLSGSPQAAAAVEYTRGLMEDLGLDSVWLQPCVVPRWVRGEKEVVRVAGSESMGAFDLNGVALGNSVGTGPDGVSAEVIEVLSLDELRNMDDKDVEGRIVFFNRPMDVTLINTFRAYGRAVDQRGTGPIEAAKKGAVAAIVRSMTNRLDDIPHTGTTGISEEGFNIPSVAISTNDAELLGKLVRREKVRVYIRTTSKMLEPVTSYNVIGQINGSAFPGEIIAVGGHLDSWDLGHGAHDDGAGCMQSLEVMRTIKAMNYIPKRTIRCVLFMNEENGLAGATTYAAISNEHDEFHIAAIESDAGGFTPRGFTCAADGGLLEPYLAGISNWWGVMDAYDLYIQPGGSGADIRALQSQGGILFGLRPDSQRYFDFHHTDADRIEAVNARELKLGAAAMTGLVYMLDNYLKRAD